MLVGSVRLSLLVWIWQWPIIALAQNCYTPGGDDRNEQFGASKGLVYVPCNGNTGHSMCCSTGPQGSGDQCRDGLCYNAGGNVWWRESCTDRTWRDPACIRLFVNGTGLEGSEDSITGVNNITDVSITPCENYSYCYGTGPDALSCCRAGLGFFIGADNNQTRQNPDASKTSPTDAAFSTASVISASAFPEPSASTNRQGHDRLSTGAKAGIGIGVSLGALLIIGLAIAVILLLRRQRGQQSAIVTPYAELHGQSPQAPTMYHQSKAPPFHQAMPQGPAEMSAI